MPNFWTRTVQNIKESIKGPRTNDKDFQSKLDEMNKSQEALTNLKLLITNFTKFFEKILTYNRDISECIFILYNNNTEYQEFANILTSVHVDNNKIFQSIVNDISHLSTEAMSWDKYYSGIKNLVEKREEARKVYDHYEKKLEKLEDKKEIKIREGSYQVGSDFHNIVHRNEIKYITAKDEYVQKATLAYDTIERLNYDKFNMISPVLLNLFFIEMRLYETFSNKYSNYKDIEDKLTRMREEFSKKKSNTNYNPMQYTKSQHLELKFDNQPSRKEIKSTSPSLKKKKSIQKEEEIILTSNNPNVPRSSIRKQTDQKEGANNLFNELNPNMEKLRSGSQMQRKPSNQIQVFGEFNFEEFNNIGNQYSNPAFTSVKGINKNNNNNNIMRIDTVTSQFHNLDRNPTNYQNYPTLTSVIEANPEISRTTSRKSRDFFQETDPNFPNNAFVGSSSYKISIKETQGHTSNVNNANMSKQAFNFPESTSHGIGLKKQPNVFQNPDPFSTFNFTKQNENIPKFENQEKRLANYGQQMVPTNSDINSTPEEIDFNELLNCPKGTNSTSVNPIARKIDPFEGFY